MVSMIVAPVLGLAGLSVEARQRHPRMANARRFLSTRASVFNKDDISDDFIKTLEGKNSMAKVKAFLSLFDGASNKAICNLGKAIALDILFQSGAARAVAHPSQMHHFDVIYFMQRIGRQTESVERECPLLVRVGYPRATVCFLRAQDFAKKEPRLAINLQSRDQTARSTHTHRRAPKERNGDEEARDRGRFHATTRSPDASSSSSYFVNNRQPNGT
jgi:hypothetical protein